MTSCDESLERKLFSLSLSLRNTIIGPPSLLSLAMLNHTLPFNVDSFVVSYSAEVLINYYMGWSVGSFNLHIHIKQGGSNSIEIIFQTSVSVFKIKISGT